MSGYVFTLYDFFCSLLIFLPKIFIVIIIGLAVATGTIWADTVGDINADGKITLIEAIGSLQIAGGSKVASYTNEEIYNTTEYSMKEPLPYKKFWRQTEYGYENNKKINIGILSFSKDTLNDQIITAITYETGIYADYNLIDYTKDHQLLGWKWDGQFETFDPPVTTMMDNWQLGHRIINMTVLKSELTSGLSESYQYREYMLLGVEDVTVPARTFKDCLKIMSQRSGDSRRQIKYLAKGIGMVKHQRR